MFTAQLHALPLTLADVKDDEARVIIWCLNCSRKQTIMAYLLRKMVGPIAFGTINSRFVCRGCSSKVAVALPAIAPTPHEWTKAYRPLAVDKESDQDMPASYFPFHIEEWANGDVSRYVGQVTDLQAANACFDLAVSKLGEFGTPYVTIRHHGRILRDSRRDFKVV